MPQKKKEAQKSAKAVDEDADEEKKPVDSDREDQDAGEEMDLAMFGKKKKKKAKESADAEGGGGGDDGEKAEKKKKEKKEKKQREEPRPLVCEVLEVAPVPKKDKLRLCKVCWAEGKDPVDVVTNAPNVVAGKKFLVALPGVTTADGIEVKEAKVGGVESCGMFCGPVQMGWATDVLDEKLAVMLSDSASAGSSAPTYEEALEAFQERERAEKAEKEAKEKEESKGKKGGKKKAQKGEEEDLDALLQEFNVEIKEEPAKGKKKKGKQGKQEDEDLDAVLEEKGAGSCAAAAEPEKPAAAAAAAAAAAEEEPPAAAAAGEAAAAGAAEAGGKEKEEEVDAKTLANRKKKEKKKGKKADAAADDEDFDAALDEFKQQEPAAAEAAEEAKEEEAKFQPQPRSAAAAEAKDDEEAKADEDEGAVDAKTLANRKKKEKKKAKQQQAVGGEGMWGDSKDEKAEEGAPAAEAPKPAASSSAPAPKKGGKEKKESAVVKAARERLEMEAKLEAERKAFEEEQRRIREEEERKEREEREAEEAERERKRLAREAKIQKQKEEGTYQTKAQKARAARAAQLRAQFGFTLEKEEEDGENGEEKAPEQKKSRVVISSKKKKPPKREEKKDEGAEEEKDEDVKGAEKAEEEKPAPEPKTEAAKAKDGEDDEEDGDNWEKVAEKMDDEEEDKSDSDSSNSDSDSDSSKSDDSDSDSDSSFAGYRSPIIVIMGHVDTGKTKLLDKIRRTNVQANEAGGITQQIGATYFPDIALQAQTEKVDPDFELEVPGVMVIDTPGHESFNNLRQRGSSLCDLAILVIDITHGLEPQTVESLELLKKRRCPFVIALNKIDKCYQWESESYTCVRKSLARQQQSTTDHFMDQYNRVALELNERGLNVALYWENTDYKRNISVIPTSAHTGEGVPDLLYMLLMLSQKLMASNLEVKEDLECTVIEVKNIEGLGTTIDVILVNGTLREGDTIVLGGMNGPIVTTIRTLLTPQPMKEMRVKNEYVHHAMINQSMGIKICAVGLEEAMAGGELLVVGPDDDLEEKKDIIAESLDSILADFEKQAEGVYVKASTLGSLEALLSFLQDEKIPVFEVGIGEVHKKDVRRAMIMKEKKHPEYAIIMAFDVKVSTEAQQQADHDGVQIFTADIIYHLKDKFKTYMDKVREATKTEKKAEVVFPVMLSIDKQHVFCKKDPIIFACNVIGGQLRIGTPLCVPEKDNLEIGRVAGIEKDKGKPLQIARRGDLVCVKVEQNTAQKSIAYGRHFDASNQLCSLISRNSIDTLKENFKDEMKKEDWELVIALKKIFNIQ